jgi:hypothetical protein
MALEARHKTPEKCQRKEEKRDIRESGLEGHGRGGKWLDEGVEGVARYEILVDRKLTAQLCL